MAARSPIHSAIAGMTSKGVLAHESARLFLGQPTKRPLSQPAWKRFRTGQRQGVVEQAYVRT
jgi:hypothetical protein